MTWIDKLEDLIWVRIFLIVLFVTFGFSAIIINAVKSENQEFKDGENDKRMGVVLQSVLNIQEALKPKAVSLTEAERKEHLLESLRAEYIASHSPIDSEILAGRKTPPDDWLNRRLGELGEIWKVNTPAPKNTGGPGPLPLPFISIGNVTTQLPAKAGDEAVATVQLIVNGRDTKTVNMGQLTAVYPASADPNIQRGIENSLWGTLEDHDKKSGFYPLGLPVNNKTLAMPLKLANVTQGQIDDVKSGVNEYYFMSHIEDMRGKTLLDVCFRVDGKNQILYCREHNGP